MISSLSVPDLTEDKNKVSEDVADFTTLECN